MLLKCNAKINLGLSVTEKRADGFHNLESIFLPVPWNDIVEINFSKTFKFTSEGIDIDGKGNFNLCVQAYHLLALDFILSPVHIHLNKQIPIGAGLGGGSSDAAFVLKGLNSLFNLNLSIQQLECYASKLGSDCTFFIRNQPAYVTGKGETLELIEFKLPGHMLIVNPKIHISTKELYKLIKPSLSSVNLKEAVLLPINKWKNLIVNDFEKALLPIYPELQKLKNDLINLGADYVSMSGSGSSFYGIFKEKPLEYNFMHYNTMEFTI